MFKRAGEIYRDDLRILEDQYQPTELYRIRIIMLHLVPNSLIRQFGKKVTQSTKLSISINKLVFCLNDKETESLVRQEYIKRYNNIFK